MNSADRNDHARRSTEDAYARQEHREEFFRNGGYDHLPPIISPRPVTVQVQRPSAAFLRECDEIVARNNRRNIAATIELEMVTEGHVRKSDAELHE